MVKLTIPRDISWLSFNERVLQEAQDPSVPLKERIRFLGIFSNNLDEFYRVRVATLTRMVDLGSKMKNIHLEFNPKDILDSIQQISIQQQIQFNKVWEQVNKELKQQGIHLLTEKQLSKSQQKFIVNFFEEEVRSNIIPLMIEDLDQLPFLRDKSLYLGVVMTSRNIIQKRKYAIIEVPSKIVGRFVKLPTSNEQQHQIILLEDIIRYNLKSIFSYFGYDRYQSWVFKVTKDAEIDIDNDLSTTMVQKIEKGLKNRRKGKPVRFVYDRDMDAGLLDFLLRRLKITRNESVIPGGRIHNFRHFMEFPDVFPKKGERKKPFIHPYLKGSLRVTDIIFKRDVLLNFPYHSFNSVIDLLRESAFDPNVSSIKITAYRLAPNSKVINALINASRNGKSVTVMLELRARFDEEANLEWKEKLEEEGITVIPIIPNQKVHAKLCIITRKINQRTISYGFVSTGNFNEKTSNIYGDHCLLTSNKKIMSDIDNVFKYLENPKSGMKFLMNCKTLIPCPTQLRNTLIKLINKEIKNARAKKEAAITIKVNSLSDDKLILKLQEAARAGVKLKLIVRGIFCMHSQNAKYKYPIQAISIVDQYLEHARVFVFHNGGKELYFISSADWMVRNLDHRVEITCPIQDPNLKRVLKNILNIQLQDNVKARILDNNLSNEYVLHDKRKSIRSQVEIYHYLQQKKILHLEEV